MDKDKLNKISNTYFLVDWNELDDENQKYVLSIVEKVPDVLKMKGYGQFCVGLTGYNVLYNHSKVPKYRLWQMGFRNPRVIIEGKTIFRVEER